MIVTLLPATMFATIDGASYGSSAEWFAGGAAFVALIISVGAVYYTRRSEKRQQFIQLHDLLTSLESQAGRRILFREMTSDREIARMLKKNPESFDKVNRALGLYNTLGIHVYRGYVDKEEALAHWAGPIKQNWEAIDRFVNWRRDQAKDRSKWPYLMWFARECGAPLSAEAASRVDTDVAASTS